MSFRFTIGKRIGLGFGLLILFIFIIISFIYFAVTSSNESFKSSEEISKKISEVYEPSIKSVGELKENVRKSKNLIKLWATIPSKENSKEKVVFKRIVGLDFPESLIKLDSSLLDITPVSETQKELKTLKSNWSSQQDKDLVDEVCKDIDSLINFEYPQVTDYLISLTDYEDVFFLIAKDLVSPSRSIFTLADSIDKKLVKLENNLIKINQKAAADKDASSAATNESFQSLLYKIILFGIALITGGVLVAMFTTSTIVKPITSLKGMLLKLGRGVIPEKKMKPSNDEIGEMSVALNNLVDGFKSTTEFSRQVGSGNFDYDYQPLSNEDTLGHALLKMRDDLAENERILEQKVVERTEEVVRQRDEIERQREKVEELYKDVTDSIKYAKRLQDSILPPDKIIKDILPNSFVLFKPKDIVSGDFYWMEKVGSKTLFAAVDCTGHGVPGAFMSLVGANALNQAVREHQHNTPSDILDDLNRISSAALNKADSENAVRDGMDMALCAIDYDKLMLEYSGANNPLYIIRNGEILVTKADKNAIGSMEPKPYSNHHIQLEKDDIIYIFSDGYADQFGGIKGKKFMYRQFRETLLSLIDKPMHEHKKILDDKIEAWRGSYEQEDDILVIGVRI